MFGFSAFSSAPFGATSKGSLFIASGAESGTAADQSSYTFQLGASGVESGSAADQQSNTWIPVGSSTRIYETTRKNLFIRPDQVDTWGLSNATVTANQAANPLTTDVTADYVSNTINLTSSVTPPQLNVPDIHAGSTYIYSVYAKAVTGTGSITFQSIPMNMAGGYGAYFTATFDLINGVVTSGSSTNGIVSVGGGWYRCWMQMTAPANFTGSNTPFVGISIFIGAYGATSTATTVALWGVQLEESATITAYEDSSLTGESSSGLLTISRDGAETGSSQDTLTAVLTMTPATSESVTSSESQSNTAVFAAAGSEFGTSSDAPNGTNSPGASVIERTRANILRYTETNDGVAWSYNVGSRGTAATQTLSPDGVTLAYKFIESTTLGNQRIWQRMPVQENTTYTFSVYAKAAERSIIQVYFEDVSLPNNFRSGLQVDLSAGTPTGTPYYFGTTNSLLSYSVTSAGNGWYRIVWTVTSRHYSPGEGPNRTPNCYIVLRIADGTGNFNYTGDGTSGLYFWGEQMEIGSSVSPYMYTEYIETNSYQSNQIYSDSVVESGSGQTTQDKTIVTSSAGSETGSSNDSASAGNVTASATSETGSSQATQSNQVAFASAGSESGSAQQTSDNTLAAVAARSETGSASDLPSASALFVAYLSESGASSDLPSATYVTSSDASESGSVSDSAFSLAVFVSERSESVSAGDYLIGGLTIVSTQNEFVTSSDLSSKTTTYVSDASEYVAVTDVQSNTAAYVATARDSLLAADVASSSASFGVNIVEIHNLSVLITATARYQLSGISKSYIDISGLILKVQPIDVESLVSGVMSSDISMTDLLADIYVMEESVIESEVSKIHAVAETSLVSAEANIAYMSADAQVVYIRLPNKA